MESQKKYHINLDDLNTGKKNYGISLVLKCLRVSLLLFCLEYYLHPHTLGLYLTNSCLSQLKRLFLREAFPRFPNHYFGFPSLNWVPLVIPLYNIQ